MIAHRLLAAIGKFLFLSPTDDSSTVANLLSALDINEMFESKKTIIKSAKIQGLSRDILELVKINIQE